MTVNVIQQHVNLATCQRQMLGAGSRTLNTEFETSLNMNIYDWNINIYTWNMSISDRNINI